MSLSKIMESIEQKRIVFVLEKAVKLLDKYTSLDEKEYQSIKDLLEEIKQNKICKCGCNRFLKDCLIGKQNNQ